MKRKTFPSLGNASTNAFMQTVIVSARRWLTTLMIVSGALTTGAKTTHAELIGLSIPLSGDVAELGREFRAGARLAMEKLGGNHELFIADDGCDPDLAKLAVNDLIAQEPAIVTGFLCNEVAIIAANRFRESGIPVLVAGARSIRLVKDREREAWNLLRMSPGDDYAFRAAAEVIQQRWRAKPYAIVDDGTIFGRMYTDGLRLLLNEAGLEPQVSDNFRAAQSTQAGLLRRLERSGVEAVFIAAATREDLVVIAKNMQEFDVSLDLITSSQLATLPYLEEAGSVPPGIMVVKETLPDNEAIREVTEILKEQNILPTRQIFEGYAAVQVAITALGKDHAETTENLRSNEFQSLVGPVRFDENGANTTNPYALHIWNGDTLQPVVENPTTPTQ